MRWRGIRAACRLRSTSVGAAGLTGSTARRAAPVHGSSLVYAPCGVGWVAVVLAVNPEIAAIMATDTDRAALACIGNLLDATHTGTGVEWRVLWQLVQHDLVHHSLLFAF